MKKIPREIKISYSADALIDNGLETIYTTEFLNSLTIPNFPPFKLEMKKGVPLILLRNLNPSLGLCNGTRLILKDYSQHGLICVIKGGEHHNRVVIIPRIPMELNECQGYSFKWQRRQFPVKLAFAMTTNKSQGKTFENVGVYLQNPVFSHGQLYVASSRV